MEKQRKQNKKGGDDRISVLPEPIIHEILSHVHDTKAAARTSVLSKTWQRAWASFPRIVFGESDFNAGSIERPNYSPEKNRRIRMKKNDFMTSVDKTLRNRNSSVEEFALELTYHDKELVLPRVVEWLTIATERKVKALCLFLSIIHFSDGNKSGKQIYYSLPHVVLEAKTITELRLKNCKLEPCNEFKFCHLKTLVLNHVRLDEQVIQNLTLRCPLIENFQLYSCHGLKQLKVSNLPRLNLLHVLARREVSRIEIKAPSLQTFCYWSNEYYSQSVNLHCDIYLEACKNLKRLELIGLSNRTIELLQNLSSKFPTLEVLEISTCKMESIKISSQTLKMFKLEECTNLEVVEVDAPNLVSLHCRLNKSPLYSFNAPSLQEVELEFDLGSCFSLWFDKLKELVGKFNSTEGLNLVIHSERKVILLDGLNERVLSSVIDLKDLRPTIFIISSMSSSDLVERILLDYSVETLSILSRSSKLLEVLNEKLLNKLFKSRILHESLFDVKVEKIDGEEDPKYSKWIALLKSYRAVDYQTTNFKLDWKND